MDITVASNAQNTYSQAAVQRPQAPKAQQVADAPAVELLSVAVRASDDVEQARFDQMERASQAYKDLFVLSDTRFTIFKDRSGEYITRFTNLRDGSITYYPERYMHEFFEGLTGASPTVVSAEA